MTLDDDKVANVLDLHDERRRLSHEIRQIIARLDLMPNGNVQNLQPTAVEHEVGRARGGNAPGRIDPNGPREFALKDADHFRRRLASAHSIGALRSILEDAQAAEDAWKRTPMPSEGTPAHPRFKAWVCEQFENNPALPIGKFAGGCGVSRQYIDRILDQYGVKRDRRAA